ncbi:MAG: UvrD-helicase domain-containing protein, partial [Spirochaetaceae bacterium]|nr:UvrD-helicase domain-containing protein [Spirochaetaceae bacterium]
INTDPEFAEVYQKYETRLRETGNVDFGDLIMLPVQILKTDPVLKAEIQNRFDVIMVDEYQDSNVAQFQLLQQLAGPDTYVCVVGDDDQSIYSFRGAEVQNILTFSEHFPNTQIIKLERNYRSTSPILDTAINVVSCNEHRLGKTLDSQRGTGKKPTLVFLSDQDEEADFCAELIKKAAAKGCPYSDWAVLYRTNAQSLGFESEFVKKQIPYKVVGSLKFYEREEIKDVLAYLAIILNPKDEIHFSRIVNKPARALGDKTQ